MKNQADVFVFPERSLDVRVYVGSECHTSKPTRTLVDFAQDHVVVECSECGKEIVRFEMVR